MTYAQAVKDAETFLLEHEITDASVDAWLLFSYVTQISRAMFLAERMRQMPEVQYQRYQELLKKRASHIPLQHLTGEQEFMGFSFLVNHHVLVPRQDTETLVEMVLSHVKPGMRVLDLCTGSGCIAISLAKLCEGLQVDAADFQRKRWQWRWKMPRTLKRMSHSGRAICLRAGRCARMPGEKKSRKTPAQRLKQACRLPHTTVSFPIHRISVQT